MTKRFSLGTLFSYAVWIAIPLLAFNLGRLMKRSQANAGTNVTIENSGERVPPIPYTLVRRTILFGPHGRVEGPTETEAVRGDGSWMERTEDFKGDRVVSSSHIFLVTGKRITVNHVGERKTSVADVVPPQPMRDPRTDCTKLQAGAQASGMESVEGEEKIAGYRAIRIKHGMFTEWWAPELGCAKIKSYFDPEKGSHTVHELVSVTVGEPDAALFTVPVSYEEVPPSKLFALPGPDPLRMRAEDSAYYLKNREVR